MNATDAAIEAATIETGRYRVARISGRYRVIDNGGAILATVASKAVGQKWIDRKVQAAVELAEQAVAEQDSFAAKRAAASLAADLAEAPAVIADTAKLTEEQAATITRNPADAIADAIRSGRTDFIGTVGELLGGATLDQIAARQAAAAQAAEDAKVAEAIANAVPNSEEQAAAQERPTMPEGAVVRHVIVTAAGRLPFASRSRATRAFEAAVAAGQPVAWESAAGRVLRSHPAN